MMREILTFAGAVATATILAILLGTLGQHPPRLDLAGALQRAGIERSACEEVDR